MPFNNYPPGVNGLEPAINPTDPDTWDDDLARAWALAKTLLGFTLQWPNEYTDAELATIGELHDLLQGMNGY